MKIASVFNYSSNCGAYSFSQLWRSHDISDHDGKGKTRLLPSTNN